MRQSEKSGSGNSSIRKSGGSNNMTKKDEEGKRSAGSLNSYQKNSQQLKQPSRIDKNNHSSSGDSRFISASFGGDTNNQTLKNSKETAKIVELLDPRSQRSMPQHNSRPSAQTQVTAKANLSGNIQNAQSNFSFASGSIPPHSKQNSNLIQTRTDGSNSYMSPHQMKFGSVSPTPEVFSSEIGLSGGQVGLSQRSNDFGARQLTSSFPLKNQNVTNFDANSYMPVQMSADTVQSQASSKEEKKVGQVRTASEIQKSQDYLVQINKQNEAIMQRIKERNNSKNEPEQRISKNIEFFQSSGNQNFSQLRSYAADGASMTGDFTATKGSYISSQNQGDYQAATDYPSDRLNIFNQQQYMNSSADKMAFGLPMPMSPQEEEFSQKRFLGVQKDGLDSQREGSYELDGQQQQKILNGFRMDQFDDQNSLHQKIDQLRKYRMLCEQRIMQLYPGHPMPVQDHHLLLGKFYDSNEDIDGNNLPLKQHLDLVCHEKAQLEKALRDETLANEEQRNYIQILKNVIEQKLERDGLMELLKQGGRSDYNTFGNTSKSNMNDDTINIFISLSDMKHQLDQTRLENNKYIEQLKHQEQVLQKMENDFNSKITNANKQLKFYHEQCLILQNQVQPANERCEYLEDYVKKQMEQIEKLNKELGICKNQGVDPDGTNNTMFQQLLDRQSPNEENYNPHQKASLQSQINQQDHQISQNHSMTTDVKQSLCNEIEGLNKELRSVQRACQLSKEQFYQVELESQKQHQQIQSLQEKLSHKDTEIRQLKQSLELASTDLFQKEQQLESLQFSNLQLEKRIDLVANKDKFKDFERSKQIEEAQLNYIDEQRKVEELSNNLENTSKQLTKELQTIKEALRESENELNQKTQEVERLDSELDLKIAQLESYQRSGKQDKQSIRDLTTKLEDRQIQIDDLKIEKLKRDEKMQLDSNARDQLMKEKAQLNLQVNELSHQLEIIKMQNQTTIVKSEQQVKEATSRADALERIQKSRLSETEILTNELTKTSCHLKQAQSQLLYYEKANEQLSADLRKSKSDIDSFEREKIKQATEISNLVEENEQLYRNEERARRINEELQSQKNQAKNLEKEISDLDKKLRASYEVKEAQDLEINKLKREIQTLESDKITLIKQKETLSIQTRDSERRIFDYVKMNQDNDQKIRQNAIFIKDLVQERDKYKELQEEKEKEIGQIGLEIKVLRQKLTDLTLIEEKVHIFLENSEATINQNKKQLHDFLRQFLRTINSSDILCQKVNMRKRDQGFQIQDKLSYQATQEHIQVWQRMAAFQNTQLLFGETNEYLIELLDLLLQNFVELNADAVKKERQVSHLESKLGSIHSVDYQAQQQAINLRDELSDLRRKFAEAEFEKEREIQCLNETLKLVQNHNLDLQHVATLTEKQRRKKNSEKTGKAKQRDNEMNQTLQLLQMEKQKLLDLLNKILNFLKGQPSEKIIEKMMQSALAIAKSLSDKETLSTEISKYEVQLQLALIEAHRQQETSESTPIKPGTLSSMKLSVGSPVHNDSKQNKFQSLKLQITQKEDQMQEIEDKIAFEQGKYNMLQNQLQELRKEGDFDMYPNREKPFLSQKGQQTHSFEMMLKETKELRLKLNEKNTMINSLENELKKIKTMQTMKFQNDSPQSERYNDYDNRDSELKL